MSPNQPLLPLHSGLVGFSEHISRPPSSAFRNLDVRSLPRKYLMVVVSGGLNQQRNQIVDAVIIARILRAALVIPVFKEVLKNDVVIVSSLPPKQLMRRRVRGPIMPFQANEDWVLANYGTKLRRDSIFLLRAFDSRLSKDLNADLRKVLVGLPISELGAICVPYSEYLLLISCTQIPRLQKWEFELEG